MLTIRQGVKLNVALSSVVQDLAPYTAEAKIEITSGVREPLDQLHLIGWYANEKNVHFPEFDPQDLHGIRTIDGQAVATWQRTWSRLLHIGVIINPPLAAECLEDYIRNGKNKKGEIIQGSPHSAGTAFDISANIGSDIVEMILKDAQTEGVAIKNWLVERENNAVHVNIKA